MAGFFARRIDVAADKPAIGAYQRELGQDLRCQPGFVGKPREIRLFKVVGLDRVTHADGRLVHRRHDPHGLFAQAQGQVAVLADLRIHGIAPGHIHQDGHRGPGHEQDQGCAPCHHSAQGQAGWPLGRRWRAVGPWVREGGDGGRRCRSRHGQVFPNATAGIIGGRPTSVTGGRSGLQGGAAWSPACATPSPPPSRSSPPRPGSAR